MNVILNRFWLGEMMDKQLAGSEKSIHTELDYE